MKIRNILLALVLAVSFLGASWYSEIQFRRDTAANWTSVDPVLKQGEPGYETDTGKLKIGDGLTHWTSLSYLSGGGAAGSFSALTTGTNTTATMTVGTGGTLTYSGTGVVNASSYKGVTTPSALEFSYLAGVVSNLQTQLNNKQSLGSYLTLPVGSSQGDIFYVNAAGQFSRLAAGTLGQFLQTQGSGENPKWASGGGGPGSYTFVQSLVNSDGIVSLAGDATTPGVNRLYSTNADDSARGYLYQTRHISVFPSGDTSGADDVDAITAAIALASSSGSRIVRLEKGIFYLDDEVVVDVNDVIIEGVGDATDESGTSVRLLSDTAAFHVTGPVNGWGFRNLYIQTPSGASKTHAIGIQVDGGRKGYIQNVHIVIVGDSQIGYLLQASLPSTNSAQNVHDNLTIYMHPDAENAIGVKLTGGTTAGACMNIFRQLEIQGNDATQTLIYLAASDTNTFIGTSLFAGSSLAITPIVFDYSINSGWPSDTYFYGIDYGYNITGGATNVGTPGASARTNGIWGFGTTNGASAPSIDNLTVYDVSSGSMTWPSGGAGIPNYNGSSTWGTTYDASNKIPSTFIPTLNQNTTGTAAGLTAQYIDWTASSGGASIKNKPTIPGYPGAGVPNSTGSAWGLSYTVGTSAYNLVQLDSSARLPAVSALNLTLPATTTGGVMFNSSGSIGVASGVLSDGIDLYIGSLTYPYIRTYKSGTDAFLYFSSGAASADARLGHASSGTYPMFYLDNTAGGRADFTVYGKSVGQTLYTNGDLGAPSGDAVGITKVLHSGGTGLKYIRGTTSSQVCNEWVKVYYKGTSLEGTTINKTGWIPICDDTGF